MILKNLVTYFAPALALLAAPLASAFTYTDGDVLLIFRADGKNNVEFNLGNIGQFLNQSNGYTAVVTNWSLAVVTNTYALTGDNAQFAVIGASNSSSSRAWVSDSQPLNALNDVTASTWAALYSIIHAVGSEAASDLLQSEAPPGTNYIDLNPSGTTERFSFDYIASNDGQNSTLLPFLGGFVSAKVTGVSPATVLFYEIDAHGPPQPAASLIGSFALGADGTLTFLAGPLLDAPLITSVTAGGGVASVGFTPKTAVKYRLLYSPELNADRSTWTVTGRPVAGNGATTASLTDGSATNAARFYSVESYP